MNQTHQQYSSTFKNPKYNMLQSHVPLQKQCSDSRSTLMPKPVPRYLNSSFAANQHPYFSNKQPQSPLFQANPNRDQNLLISAPQSCMYGGNNAFFNDTFSVMQLPVQNNFTIETKGNVSTHSTTSIGAQVENLSSEIRIVNDNILQSTRSLSIETNNDSYLNVQENSNKHFRTVSEEVTKAKEQLQKDTENCYFLTGTVEKVISWNKLLVNTRTFFEVIAKCLSIHEGITPITKQLLIRNERGPVLQVFYYEIDFSLDSEVTPGEYIRCVGHMVESNKLVAYSVQLATLHEVTTLQRFTFISDNVARKISNFTANMK